MSIPDVIITKAHGLGRRDPSEDHISGLILQGVATDDIALGDIITLQSPADAENYGIDQEYDDDNKLLVYHHIKRFFYRNPSATLYLMLVSTTVTLTDMCDKTKEYLKKLLVQSEGKIRQAAVGLNTEGSFADVLTAVVKAQSLAKEEYEMHRPVNILIEGRNFDTTATLATNLRSLASSQVCVVIGADNDVSTKIILEGYDALQPYLTYAAIGDTLGCVSMAKVNECIGWVGKFPLTDAAEGYFVKAGISNGTLINDISDTDQRTLHDKGYIFVKHHTGKSGYWFQSSPTCDLVSVDEAYLENARTLNKASRIIRAALIDDLNRPIPLTEEGRITPSMIGYFEGKCTAGLDNMIRDEEISAASVYIDPSKVFFEEGEKMDIVFKIVPVGVARTIEGVISLTLTL